MLADGLSVVEVSVSVGASCARKYCNCEVVVVGVVSKGADAVSSKYLEIISSCSNISILSNIFE